MGTEVAAENQTSTETSNSGVALAPLPDVTPAPVKVASLDFLYACLIFIGAIAYSFPATLTLEFFRHTEADRTLIAINMSKSGHYLIPQLLGDAYLTKPPLFYILMSLIFDLVDSHQEWAARLISVLSSSLLLSAHYLFCRAGLRLTRHSSLLSTLMLATCGAFFIYSSLAEIDMTFALLVNLSLYLLLWKLPNAGQNQVKTSLKPNLLLLGAYSFMVLAFLVKGPTAFIFTGSTVLGILALAWRQGHLLKTTREHLLASILPLLGLLVWLAALVYNTSVADMYAIIDEELLQRFISDPKATLRSRGPLFYLFSIPAAFLPWSFAFLGLLWPTGKLQNKFLKLKTLTPLLFAIGLPLLFHSAASGKSARYLFPLFPILAIFATSGAMRLQELSYTKSIFNLLLKIAGLVAIIGAPVLLIYTSMSDQGFKLSFLYAALLAGLSGSFLLTRYALANWTRSLTALCLFFMSGRFIQCLAIDELRNREYSVAPVVSQLEEELSSHNSHELYVLEMFERWIPYYLTDKGVQTFRITPALAKAWENDETPALLLINKNDEFWRWQQLQEVDPKAEIISNLASAKNEFLLISFSKQAAAHFAPRRLFPTNLSEPPASLLEAKNPQIKEKESSKS